MLQEKLVEVHAILRSVKAEKDNVTYVELKRILAENSIDITDEDLGIILDKMEFKGYIRGSVDQKLEG